MSCYTVSVLSFSLSYFFFLHRSVKIIGTKPSNVHLKTNCCNIELFYMGDTFGASSGHKRNCRLSLNMLRFSGLVCSENVQKKTELWFSASSAAARLETRTCVMWRGWTHTHRNVFCYCVCCTQAVMESLKSCWLTKTRRTISFSSRKEKKPEEKLRLLLTDVFLKCWSISRSFGSLSVLQTSLGTKRAVQTFSWSEADDWQLPNVYLWKHAHARRASSGRSVSLFSFVTLRLIYSCLLVFIGSQVFVRCVEK